MFYFHEEKSANVVNVNVCKVNTKEKKGKEDKEKSEKVGKEEDNERVKKFGDLNEKKQSKHNCIDGGNKFGLVKIQIETCSQFNEEINEKKKWGSQNCTKDKKSRYLQKLDSLEKPATKKPASSPFKKLSRSSLTIEPDKITVNLSKYSPCASRLAASSKILSSTSPTSPESPLRAVRSRNPSNFERSRETGIEKSTIQASLSLNIRQFQRTNPAAPRSRSVGDSCVTSPTSEGTTTSCSPTGTEILSLEEVGVQSNESENRKETEKKEVEKERLSTKSRKTTLETKC